MNSRRANKCLIILPAAVLLALALLSIVTAAEAMMLHNAEFVDDFIMRYRESKYVVMGMNPFEVVLRHREPLPEIGDLWDVAGYTPWGMALGIVLNFTFLPEHMARMAYMCFYIAFAVFMLVYVYKKSAEYLGGNVYMRALVVCIAAAFPAWGTALSWLNFGAVFGGLIFLSVMLSDEHEITAGILLGLAATKPQLALPFYLAYLLRKKYRTFAAACIVPLVLWAVCAVMTGTSPLLLVLQLSEVTSKLAGDLGGWMMRFGIALSGKMYRLLCAAGGIGLALFFWYHLKKTGKTDKLTWFSVPAVMCGIWTYSQDHDQTVLLILLFCLVGSLKSRQGRIGWKQQACTAVFLFALVINPEIFNMVWQVLVKDGPDVTLIFKLMRYVLLVLSLFFISFRPEALSLTRQGEEEAA